jgi:hypothetical protein
MPGVQRRRGLSVAAFPPRVYGRGLPAPGLTVLSCQTRTCRFLPPRWPCGLERRRESGCRMRGDRAGGRVRAGAAGGADVPEDRRGRSGRRFRCRAAAAADAVALHASAVQGPGSGGREGFPPRPCRKNRGPEVIGAESAAPGRGGGFREGTGELARRPGRPGNRKGSGRVRRSFRGLGRLAGRGGLSGYRSSRTALGSEAGRERIGVGSASFRPAVRLCPSNNRQRERRRPQPSGSETALTRVRFLEEAPDRQAPPDPTSSQAPPGGSRPVKAARHPSGP